MLLTSETGLLYITSARSTSRTNSASKGVGCQLLSGDMV